MTMLGRSFRNSHLPILRSRPHHPRIILRTALIRHHRTHGRKMKDMLHSTHPLAKRILGYNRQVLSPPLIRSLRAARPPQKKILRLVGGMF